MLNSKKVLFISSEFPPLPGGIGVHAHQLSKALIERKWTLKVLTNQRDKIENENQFDILNQIDILRIQRRKFTLITYFDRLLKSIKLLLQFKPNVVILSGQFSVWLVPVLKFFKPSVKFISIAHGSEIIMGNKLKKMLTARGFESSNKVVCVSKFTLKILIENTKVTHGIVINNGIFTNGLDIENHSKIQSQELQLLTIGNLTLRKGQINVIKALPELLKFYPKLTYHMIGIPTAKQEIINEAKSLGLLSHIKIHGVLNNEEKNNVLANSDIFLMLSNFLPNGDFEGFGIAIIEANSFGLPAIGSKNSGISDAINHGYSGLCIHSSNDFELIEAIKTIIDNYQEFSINAKKWSKNFHWDRVVKEYERILL